MYCISSEFTKKMQIYINEIERESNGVLNFIEYISLPHFGNVILRFDIAGDNYTLADVDAYETFMQGIVQDEFLVDFMGSVYKKLGFEPWMYEEKFRNCYIKYSDVNITPGIYHQMLSRDAAYLLRSCGLSEDIKVWEIQAEEDLALYILGGANREIGTYALASNTVHVHEVEEAPCVGLMRAAMYAKEQQLSIVHVLLDA